MKDYIQWEKYVYQKYEDLKIPCFKRLEPLTRKGKECNYLVNDIPIERYSVSRTLTKDKIKDIKYARKAHPIYKYDLREREKALEDTSVESNEEKEMVQIVINLPQYIGIDGKPKPEEIETFKSDYSPALLEQILKDYLNLDVLSENFDNKYRVNGRSKSKKDNNTFQELLTALEDYAKTQGLWVPYSANTDSVWIIRYQYRYNNNDNIFTFCIDVNNNYQIFSIYLNEHLDKIVSDLVHNLPDLHFICGNLSGYFSQLLKEAFPNAKFVLDYFQFPIYIANILKFENYVGEYKVKLVDICKKAHRIIYEQYQKTDFQKRIHKYPVKELKELVEHWDNLNQQYPHEDTGMINLNHFRFLLDKFYENNSATQFSLGRFNVDLSYRLQTVINRILANRKILSPERLYFHMCCSWEKLSVTSADIDNILDKRNRTQVLPFDMIMRPSPLSDGKLPKHPYFYPDVPTTFYAVSLSKPIKRNGIRPNEISEPHCFPF